MAWTLVLDQKLTSISKQEYRKSFIKDVVKDYFDNSYKQTVSLFIEEKNLSNEDLDELIDLFFNALSFGIDACCPWFITEVNTIHLL